LNRRFHLRESEDGVSLAITMRLWVKLDQQTPQDPWQARRAILFLVLATLALQISWVLPLFGLAQTPASRHLVRVLVKWVLFAAFVGMMRTGSVKLTWRELGFTSEGWGDRAKAVGLAVLLTVPVAALFSTSPALRRLVYDNLSGWYTGEAVVPRGPVLLMGILLVAFTAAFVEELLWRGYALAVLPARVGLFSAVVISSTLFGLTHTYTGGRGVVLTLAVGIALSLVYWWKRRLLVNIVVHFLFDVAAPLYVLYKPWA
jgi:membrane protease YdiL (CAAX protease family)